MKIRIDTYYDITCDGCCRSWSTDFDGNKMTTYKNYGGMGMAANKQWLGKSAYAAGWRNYKGKTLCPECMLLHEKD